MVQPKSKIILQKYIQKLKENKNKLEPIAYRGDKIKINDINVFIYKKRSKNDRYNKKRENIISCIINNIIPEQYYTLSPRWYNLKNQIKIFIKELCKKKGICNDNIEIHLNLYHQ